MITIKRIFLLFGKMGVGKTTFVKNFLNNDIVHSPTYSLCNRYEINNKTIAHFDLFNMKTIDYDLIFDAFQSCDYVFIEWANLLDFKKIRNFESEIIKMYF